MTYLAKKQQIETLNRQTTHTLRLCLVTDMPLQPWMDLYLQQAFAEHQIKLEIQRIAWHERHGASTLATADLCLIWPSNDVQAEIDPQLDMPGIWVSGETLSSPIQQFYGAAQPQKREEAETAALSPELPKGSRSLHLPTLIAKLGLQDSLASRAESRFGDQYSPALQEQVAIAAYRLYETLRGRRKKCIVLDCDGVLWEGIISEDGMNGIGLSETGKGAAYRRFQQLLKQLQSHGLLLAICSKNEPDEVRQVFRAHSAMALCEEDIAAWAVGWEPKSVQLASLSNQLQIDPQDMIMVDDNEWELAEVQSRFPQIAAVLFTPETIVEKLAEHIFLLPEDQNEQNRLRVQTYADQAKREALKENAASYEEFLQKLQTTVQIREAQPADWPRISDLSRRGNQGSNGVRYGTEELQALVESGYHLQAVYVSDRYRDLGLVGCLGLSADGRTLDLFCLSCRALGRRLEQQLLAALPPTVETVRFADTGKNAQLRELLERAGRLVDA